jgi:beta-lactamase regulating signal transducer with metallopeptidase domain
MINILIQTSFIILLGWGIVSLLRFRSYPLKYGIWLSVLLGIILSPLFYWGSRQMGINTFNISIPLSRPNKQTDNRLTKLNESLVNYPQDSLNKPDSLPEIQQKPSSILTQPVIPIVNNTVSPQYNTSTPPDYTRSVISIVFLVLVIGGIFFLIRLVYGWIVLHRLKNNLTDISNSSDIPSFINEIQHILGLKKHPIIRASTKIGSPISIGVFKPIVILPAMTINALQPEQIRDILIHETAHIVHHDHFIGVLQRLIQIAYWFNPLIYVMNNRLSQAREEICDNYVLKAGRKAPAYAKCLIDLVETTTSLYRLPATIGLIHPRWRLEDRISGLLRKERNMMTKLNTIAIGVLAVALITVVGIIAGCGILPSKVKTGHLIKMDTLISLDGKIVFEGSPIIINNDEEIINSKDGNMSIVIRPTITEMKEEAGFDRQESSKRILKLGEQEKDIITVATKIRDKNGNILTSPRLTVYNGQKGWITMGEDQPDGTFKGIKVIITPTIITKVNNNYAPQEDVGEAELKAAIRIESSMFPDKAITDSKDIATILGFLDFSKERRKPCECDCIRLDFIIDDTPPEPFSGKYSVEITEDGWNFGWEKGDIRLLLKKNDNDDTTSIVRSLFEKAPKKIASSGQLDPKQEGKIAELIKQLGADDWQTREKATEELIKIGEPAFFSLKEATQDKDAERVNRAKVIIKAIKWSVLRALGDIGQIGMFLEKKPEFLTAEEKQEFARMILDNNGLCKQPVQNCRTEDIWFYLEVLKMEVNYWQLYHAANAVAQIAFKIDEKELPNLVETLLTKVWDADKKEHKGTIIALKEIGHPVGYRLQKQGMAKETSEITRCILAKIFEEKDRKTCCNLAQALGALYCPPKLEGKDAEELTQLILEKLKDKEATVRYAAVVASCGIAQLCRKSDIIKLTEVLVTMFEDKDIDVCQAVVNAFCGWIGDITSTSYYLLQKELPANAGKKVAQSLLDWLKEKPYERRHNVFGLVEFANYLDAPAYNEAVEILEQVIKTEREHLDASNKAGVSVMLNNLSEYLKVLERLKKEKK